MGKRTNRALTREDIIKLVGEMDSAFGEMEENRDFFRREYLRIEGEAGRLRQEHAKYEKIKKSSDNLRRENNLIRGSITSLDAEITPLILKHAKELPMPELSETATASEQAIYQLRHMCADIIRMHNGFQDAEVDEERRKLWKMEEVGWKVAKYYYNLTQGLIARFGQQDATEAPKEANLVFAVPPNKVYKPKPAAYISKELLTIVHEPKHLPKDAAYISSAILNTVDGQQQKIDLIYETLLPLSPKQENEDSVPAKQDNGEKKKKTFSESVAGLETLVQNVVNAVIETVVVKEIIDTGAFYRQNVLEMLSRDEPHIDEVRKYIHGQYLVPNPDFHPASGEASYDRIKVMDYIREKPDRLDTIVEKERELLNRTGEKSIFQKFLTEPKLPIAVPPVSSPVTEEVPTVTSETTAVTSSSVEVESKPKDKPVEPTPIAQELQGVNQVLQQSLERVEEPMEPGLVEISYELVVLQDSAVVPTEPAVPTVPEDTIEIPEAPSAMETPRETIASEDRTVAPSVVVALEERITILYSAELRDKCKEKILEKTAENPMYDDNPLKKEVYSSIFSDGYYKPDKRKTHSEVIGEHFKDHPSTLDKMVTSDKISAAVQAEHKSPLQELLAKEAEKYSANYSGDVPKTGHAEAVPKTGNEPAVPVPERQSLLQKLLSPMAKVYQRVKLIKGTGYAQLADGSDSKHAGAVPKKGIDDYVKDDSAAVLEYEIGKTPPELVDEPALPHINRKKAWNYAKVLKKSALPLGLGGAAALAALGAIYFLPNEKSTTSQVQREGVIVQGTPPRAAESQRHPVSSTPVVERQPPPYLSTIIGPPSPAVQQKTVSNTPPIINELKCGSYVNPPWKQDQICSFSVSDDSNVLYCDIKSKTNTGRGALKNSNHRIDFNAQQREARFSPDKICAQPYCVGTTETRCYDYQNKSSNPISAGIDIKPTFRVNSKRSFIRCIPNEAIEENIIFVYFKGQDVRSKAECSVSQLPEGLFFDDSLPRIYGICPAYTSISDIKVTCKYSTYRDSKKLDLRSKNELK